MNFIEAVKLASEADLAFRRRSYKPAFVWLWFERNTERDNDWELVIGEIHRGVRHCAGVADLTPKLILAKDWILEKRR